MIRTETDEEGRFVLIDYSQVVYRLLVFHPKGLSGPLEHEEFVLENDLSGVLLVVPESFGGTPGSESPRAP